MSKPQAVLAECLDLWLSGSDPTPVLDRNPDVATEVSALLATAQRIHAAADSFYVVPNRERLRHRTAELESRGREGLLAMLRRALAADVALNSR